MSVIDFLCIGREVQVWGFHNDGSSQYEVSLATIAAPLVQSEGDLFGLPQEGTETHPDKVISKGKTFDYLTT